MFNFDFGTEGQLGERIPFEDHITDTVVLTKGRGVLSMFSVEGVYPGTADPAFLEMWFNQLHNALRNVAAEDIEFTFYQCRGAAHPDTYEDGLHNHEFPRRLGEAYRKSLFSNSLYSAPLFFAVEIHAPSSTSQTATKFIADATTDPEAEIKERLERLNDVCELLQVQLKGYGLKRLGYVQRGNALFDEIAEAIAFAMTGVPRQIGATTGRMGNAMFSETIRFRHKRVEFHGPGETTYGQMYAFKEYPLSTWPGMFSDLQRAPYNGTLMQSFRVINNTAANDIIGRKQNRLVLAGDKAATQTAALSHAADELMDRLWVLGDHSLIFIAFAETKKAMAIVGNAAWRDLAAAGLVATRLTSDLQAGFLSMLPGAAMWRPRPGFVKSTNLVAFTPFYSYPIGNSQGFWPGPPIAHFRSVAGTLIRFHWHVGMSGLGNTMVTGYPGGGKSLTTGFLIAMSAGRSRIAALDHKRGWKFLFDELGGSYAVLGSGQPHLAPLKALDASPHNIDFLTTLLRGCIGGTMTEEEGRRLSIALQTVMRLPAELRNVGEIRAFFDDEPEGAGIRLEKWIFGNELGWVIDAPHNTVAFDADLSCYDTTKLLDNPRARGPAMSVLFHYIGLKLDGRPLLVPIDEGWRALEDETFRPNIEKQLRTIRSKGGVIVFITQDPADTIKSGIAHVLRTMCPTHLHFPNPRAERADYVDGLKLTEGQWDAFKPLQGGQGMFLLVQGEDAIVAQLQLTGMDDFIKILSARESDLTKADQMAGVIDEEAPITFLEAAE